MLTHRDRTLNAMMQLNSALVAHNRRVALQELMQRGAVALAVCAVVAVIIVGAAAVR